MNGKIENIAAGNVRFELKSVHFRTLSVHFRTLFEMLKNATYCILNT